MIAFITNNWQPTIGGIVVIIATVFFGMGKIDQVTWTFITGAAIGWMGFTSKQHNVTGGTVQSTTSSKTTKGKIDDPPVAIPPVETKP